MRPIIMGFHVFHTESQGAFPHVIGLLSTLSSPPCNCMGVSVSGGYEAIVRTVAKLTTTLPDNCCWTLMLDFSNAFNCVNREHMFEEFRNHLPGSLLG